MRFAAPLLAFLMVLLSAAAPAADGLVSDADPGARMVVVHAPHATLRLRLATHVAENLVLHCVRELPRHGGMLVSLRPSNTATVFGPRYEFAHTDEVALDASGTVIAVLLNTPTMNENAQSGFVVRARYIIDVPAGEAVADGLLPGAAVRIDADAQTLAPERDHRHPATPRCPLALTITPAPGAPTTPPAPCIPPGPPAPVVPHSFVEGQRDVPTAAAPMLFSIESTVAGTVTVRSANDVIGPSR